MEIQKKWYESLPEMQFAINTAIKASTGFFLAQLNLGRHPRTAHALYDEAVDRTTDEVEPIEQMNKIEELC